MRPAPVVLLAGREEGATITDEGGREEQIEPQMIRPRPVPPARRRRDRLMLVIGIAVGLAFFAVMVATG